MTARGGHTHERDRAGGPDFFAESEWLRITLASIGDGVIATDAQGLIRFINPVAEELTGWSQQEAAGRQVSEVCVLIAERTGERLENPILRALREGAAAGLAERVYLVSRSGAELPISDSASPIRSSSGAIVGGVLVFRDISSRRRAEQRNEFLARLDDAIRPLAESDAILAAAARLVADHLHADRCALAEIDPAAERFAVTVDFTRNPATRAAFDRLRTSSLGSATMRELREGRPFVCADTATLGLPEPSAELLGVTQLRSMIAVPLFKGGRLVATLAVHCARAREWTKDEIDLLIEVGARCWESVERTRANRGLKAGEERLRLIMASVKDHAIFTMDAEGVITMWGMGAERVFGYTAEEMIGRTAEALFTPEDRAAERPRIELELAANTPQQTASDNRFHLRKSGERFFSNGTMEALRDDSGGLQGFVKVLRDDTERYEAGLALARLAAIIASSDDAIVSKSLDGTITSWNPSAERIFGFSAEEAIGRNISIIIPPDRLDEESAVIARLRRGEKVDHFETVRQTKDGRRLMISLTVSPVKDTSGRIVGASKVARDITQLREAEEQVRQGREELERQWRLYQAILSHTLDLAYVFDLEHRFVYANEALLRMWGKTWDEAIGKNCLELGYEPWHAALHDREIEQVITSKQPVRGEVPFTGPLGRRFYDYLFVPVINNQGEVEAVAGTTRDITDRKRSEEERELLLASERVARQEAERAGRLKDEFLATLSHELRTPLNAILGWTHILLGESRNEDTLQQGLSVIHRNARVQAELIADLLDMSRIISGKMRLNVQRVDLPEVIQAAIESVRPAAEAKEIRLQRVLEPLTDPVQGDPARLQQIVWNLVSNAVKFTPKGGRVQVVLARVNSHVEIAVSDTGKGITPEFLPFVFERFRQADSSTAREYGGLGLGLAIVKQLVELHGGVVRAASPGIGHGSTFTVLLPLSPLQQSPVEAPAVGDGPQAGKGDQPGVTDLRGISVLVIDDEQDSRELVQRVLKRAGAEVAVARSASDGLDVMLRNRPTVVLCDIGMPERDGYSFIQDVRDMGLSVPAAALTAFARPEDRTAALRAGFQLHIAKPVEPRELLAAVWALARRPESKPA